MKRATLSVIPSGSQGEPADLTDRLLQPPAPAAASKSKPKAPRRPRQRRTRPGNGDQHPPRSPRQAPPATAEPAISIDQVLQQAASTAESLRTAARSAPARYDVALRYRLEALAHHIQQVAEFLALARSQPD